jgi:hypothetical protein
MNTSWPARALALAPALLIAGSLSASDLKLDGRVSVVKMMADPVQISVRGGPNLPVLMFVDVSPGPVTLFGKTIEIGFTPSMVWLPIGVTNGNGELDLTVALMTNPKLHGAVVYMMAVVVDPTLPLPQGLDPSNGVSLTMVDRNTDLAGNALQQFPFFEHVSAFNRGSSVQLGIDPTRFPVVVGAVADVYVVASKTKAQWIADPTLTDVAGGPQSVSLGGATIQANTFTIDAGALPGPDETPGSGDTRLGVAYDLVLDLDQDGVLGGLDLIDGYHDDEAGFYVVRDTTSGGTELNPIAGPHPVTEIQYDLAGSWTPVAGSPMTMLRQDLYYPTNIAFLGQLPLVVVGHGNGQQHDWYDHIGYHLASYGNIVMSHSNDVQPGTHTAALTTLDNTDALIGLQSVIAGGALDGHIDTSKIVWIGHSRGADGIVRAYDHLFDGTFTMINYGIDDVRLLSSMTPVQDGGYASSNPHGVPYHVWVGNGDTNVPGCPMLTREWWYAMHDRATGYRQSTALYGVGHGWFHTHSHTSPWAAWVTGPCQIGETNTHLIVRGYFLPLIKRYLEGDVPSQDFLWRQYDRFRPIGVPFDPCITVNLNYAEDPAAGALVLDDHKTEPSTSVASSGASVSSNAPVFFEGRLGDGNDSYVATPSDPFNGFLMATDEDDSSGAVVGFDGAADYDLTYTLLPAQRNLSGYESLSFRAAQTTRNPLTTAELSDLTFSVTLVDGTGARSSINIGAYGGGIEEPYQRSDTPGSSACSEPGVGWNNEFETIRIRLGDFLNNGNALDLADIHRVLFEFGPAWGSAVGRIGLGEIQFTRRNGQ